jgi:hypothetical protein
MYSYLIGEAQIIMSIQVEKLLKDLDTLLNDEVCCANERAKAKAAEDKKKHAWLKDWYDSTVSGSVLRDYESGNIEIIYLYI